MDIAVLKDPEGVPILIIETKREVSPEAIRKKPGEWLLGKLRYFVDSLSRYYVEDMLRIRLTTDEKFAADLNALAVKAGYKNGLADIVGEDYSQVGTLARMMAYVLMNKLIFYKVLERHYNLLKISLKSNFSKSYLPISVNHFLTGSMTNWTSSTTLGRSLSFSFNFNVL